MSAPTALAAQAASPRTLEELPAAVGPTWFVRGYAVFHALFALAQTGVLADLASGRALRPARYAARRALDGRALEALLRYLYGLGILDRDEHGGYRAGADISELDLDLVRMFAAYDPLFRDLGPILRKEKAYGRDVVRDPRLDAEASGRICRRFSYPQIVAAVVARNAKQILDLGCGSGELLVALARAGAGIHGVGVDLAPEVVAAAAARIDEEGLGDRLRVVAANVRHLGDTISGAELGAVDLAVSSAVFHEFAYPDTNGLVTTLSAVREALPPGVPLLLAEALEQDDDQLRDNSSHALEHHVFHRLSHQGIARLDTWQPAFAEAGYELEDLTPLEGGGAIFALREATP